MRSARPASVTLGSGAGPGTGFLQVPQAFPVASRAQIPDRWVSGVLGVIVSYACVVSDCRVGAGSPGPDSPLARSAPAGREPAAACVAVSRNGWSKGGVAQGVGGLRAALQPAFLIALQGWATSHL